MPHKIYLTDELVMKSPSSEEGDFITYRTPFGLVRKDVDGKLEIQAKGEWIPLKNHRGHLLLEHQGKTIKPTPKLANETGIEYIKDRLKKYWWIILFLALTTGTITILNKSPLWEAGIFMASISCLIYQEREKQGIRQVIICLFLGVIAFITLTIFIELAHTALDALQQIMGLCHGNICETPHVLLRSSLYDSDVAGGRGRYGL